MSKRGVFWGRGSLVRLPQAFGLGLGGFRARTGGGVGEVPIRGEAWPESLEGGEGDSSRENGKTGRSTYGFHVLKKSGLRDKHRTPAFRGKPGFANPSKTHKYPVKRRKYPVNSFKNMCQHDIYEKYIYELFLFFSLSRGVFLVFCVL
jgi:hypothetical protein